MSIANYTDLQAAIGNWLGHSLFADRIPEFITMFEASANRRLRVINKMETDTSSLVATGDAGEWELPANFLAVRQVRVTSAGAATVLENVAPDYLYGTSPTEDERSPRYYSIINEDLVIRPVPSSSYTVTLLYFSKIPSLDDDNTTNWLLDEHPDLYVFGSLCEAELFGVNDTRAALWKARRDEIYEEIERLSNRARGGGTVRVFGATP